MNTRFIEAFLQVARLKSFRAAAEHLHLTQAAVSNRIQSLEEEIGARLFDRESRVLRLTAVGQRLMGYSERMLDLEQEMRLLGQPGSDLLGLVRIGATDFIVHSWLIHFLKSLQSTYPGIEVQFSSESMAGIHKALRDGTVDVALQAHQIDGDGITSIPCPSVATGWIGPVGFCPNPTDPLNDLLRLPCITMSRGSHPDLALRELYRQAQMPIGKIHHVSSIAAIMQLVEAGFGNALLPLVAARPYVEAGRIKVLDCQTRLPHQPTVVSYTQHHSQDAIRRVAELACRVSDQ
ncbi:MAG TPA: LysR family transcriptional regulator, partial [Pseudomonas sp.]|uniref:LysR family transcriptional regulator n=1 Tax=Pseudomonas sp. TaxID=306 RepID=UPI002ED9C9B1